MPSHTHRSDMSDMSTPVSLTVLRSSKAFALDLTENRFCVNVLINVE